jgi:hypothetical protein
MHFRKSQEGLIIAGFALATVMIIALLVTYLSNRVVDMIAIQNQVFFSKQAYWNAYSGMEIATSKKIASLHDKPNAAVSFATGTITITPTITPNAYQGGNKVSTITSTGSDAGGRSRAMKLTIGDPVNIAEAEWALQAYYPFNGNANDESGNGRNGTVNNDATLTTDRFDNVNSAYSFDGDEDYISNGTHGDWDALIGGAAGAALPFSVSAWIKPATLTNGAVIWQVGSPTNDGRRIALHGASGDEISFQIGALCKSNTSNTLSVGTWAHVVGTFAGGSADAAKIYINNVLDVVSSSINTGNAFLTAGVAIGYDPNTSSDSFHGIIDEVAIWNVELNADQVQSLYANSVN